MKSFPDAHECTTSPSVGFFAASRGGDDRAPADFNINSPLRVLLGPTGGPRRTLTTDSLFANVMVFDGSGAPRYPGEVLVRGNRIAAVAKGDERLDGAGAARVDGGGRALRIAGPG